MANLPAAKHSGHGLEVRVPKLIKSLPAKLRAVLPEECGQDLHDRSVELLRLLCNLLQGVDAS